jgi:hypothetical protein
MARALSDSVRSFLALPSSWGLADEISGVGRRH